MSEWQDISTAPKDWSDMMLHDPNLSSDFRTVCEGYYDCTRQKWRSAMFGTIMPTHWMPLPPPPTHNPEKEE